jgi:hypothetical protein
MNINKVCRIWDSDRGGYKKYHLLGCNTVGRMVTRVCVRPHYVSPLSSFYIVLDMFVVCTTLSWFCTACTALDTNEAALLCPGPRWDRGHSRTAMKTRPLDVVAGVRDQLGRSVYSAAWTAGVMSRGLVGRNAAALPRGRRMVAGPLVPVVVLKRTIVCWPAWCIFYCYDEFSWCCWVEVE